jgi:hypothetical protein
MVILIAVGVMNVAAMVGLPALVLIEKAWRWVWSPAGSQVSPPLPSRWPPSGFPDSPRACTPRPR